MNDPTCEWLRLLLISYISMVTRSVEIIDLTLDTDEDEDEDEELPGATHGVEKYWNRCNICSQWHQADQLYFPLDTFTCMSIQNRAVPTLIPSIAMPQPSSTSTIVHPVLSLEQPAPPRRLGEE